MKQESVSHADPFWLNVALLDASGLFYAVSSFLPSHLKSS